MLHTLAATQEVPRHTRLHSRGSTRVPPTSKGAPFLPHTQEGSFPCVVEKEFPAFPSHLKSKRSPHERREKLQGRATIRRVLQMFPHSRETCFPCTASTFKPRINSHHGGTWDSPVGKPRGKASRESHRSLDPREGKHDTAATAREESARACSHSRRGLTPLGRLQKYPKILVSAGGMIRFRQRLHTRS